MATIRHKNACLENPAKITKKKIPSLPDFNMKLSLFCESFNKQKIEITDKILNSKPPASLLISKPEIVNSIFSLNKKLESIGSNKTKAIIILDKKTLL